MIKKLLIMIIIIALVVAMMLWSKESKENFVTPTPVTTPTSGETENQNPGNPDSGKPNQPGEEGTTSTSGEENNIIVINEIEEVAMGKLAVDSREVQASDVPSDIRFFATIVPVVEAKLSHITTYYTKSNMSEDAYDILHDYVFMYFDEESEKSVKISASKEGKPLRDYHFTEKDGISTINGYEVNISHFEEKYIAAFKKGRFNFDVETDKVGQEELIGLLTDITK